MIDCVRLWNESESLESVKVQDQKEDASTRLWRPLRRRQVECIGPHFTKCKDTRHSISHFRLGNNQHRSE